MNSAQKSSYSTVNLAMTRTYLAVLRTNAIFIGIVIALINFSKTKRSMGLLVIILSIFINVFATYEYYKFIKNKKKGIIKYNEQKHIHIISPILFGITLIVLQLILVYYLRK